MLHHPAFLAGGPLAAAGMIQAAAGRIVFLSDMSGHYAPSQDHTAQILGRLRQAGVPLSDEAVAKTGLTREAWAATGMTFERWYPEGFRTKPY